jgi:hypothetical protein
VRGTKCEGAGHNPSHQFRPEDLGFRSRRYALRHSADDWPRSSASCSASSRSIDRHRLIGHQIGDNRFGAGAEMLLSKRQGFPRGLHHISKHSDLGPPTN